MKALRRFDRHGLLAIEPKAFFELFAAPESRSNGRHGAIDVVEISGPIVQRDELWCDSYESIRARFKEALESDSRAVVMRFDSPGGDTSGCFETARAMRADALAAGKPFYAYVDKACSAAYALASAATHGIAIGETCPAGSIGVISTRPDYTAANSSHGLRIAFVVSGERKLDGNPDSPITEAEIAETKKHVDTLASKFFSMLEDMRPQLTAAQVAGFDGGVFYGEDAVANGLADAVLTFDELIAEASGELMSLQSKKSEYENVRASLETLAKGSDANASAAKRALAALSEGEPPKDDESKEDEPKKEESSTGSEDADDDAKSEDDEDDEPESAGEPASTDDDEPPADKKKSAATSSSTTELSLAQEFQQLKAQMASDRERRVRKSLLSKRPDFDAKVKAVLMKAPIATLREAVETWPKSSVAAKKVTAAGSIAATRSETQIDDAERDGKPSRHSTDADLLDERMGLTTSKLGCRREGSSMVFGVVRDDGSIGKSKGAA